MHAKQCLKCGHSAAYELDPPTACPACGAIYAKVEQALRGGAPGRQGAEPRPEIQYFSAPRASSADPGGRRPDMHAFAERMRSDSLYPAWRKIVSLSTIACYVIAALILLGVSISTKGSFLGVLAGAGIAALVVIFAKVGKELSLMLADLSDAAVQLAAANDREQ